MEAVTAYLKPSEAARRLGISVKALRLYEQHGLLSPSRTAAGWRAYGAEAMARAERLVALRALGLSLAQVGRVLQGEGGDLEPLLACHEAALEARAAALKQTLERVRGLRGELREGREATLEDVVAVLSPGARRPVSFPLPWPWAGEPFELPDVRPLPHITGPLGSGKTRLAGAIAAALPGTAFLGLDRLTDGGAVARARLAADLGLKNRVEQALAWLVEDGASETAALVALLAGMETQGPAALVVDMIEEGLDRATQQALIAWLRRRGPGARPLFFLTRSDVILDLEAVGPDETLVFCPANHAPPFCVAPFRGAPGFEALASCLAPPEVRARTAGTIAVRTAAF